MEDIQIWSLTCSPNKSFQLVDYPVSMLRGVLGSALLRDLCDCKEQTGHHADCLYQSIFEGDSEKNGDYGVGALPAYTLRVTSKSGYVTTESNISIQLTLFGVATKHSKNVIASFVSALKQNCLPKQVALLCHSVSCEIPSAPWQKSNEVEVQTMSPLFIKQKGNALLPTQLNIKNLAVAIARRVESVRKKHSLSIPPLDFDKLLKETETVVLQHNCELVKWQRYSNRQKKSMPLTGLFGECRLLNLPHQSELYKALHWGQWLHGGGKTALGLGAYQLNKVDGAG